MWAANKIWYLPQLKYVVLAAILVFPVPCVTLASTHTIRFDREIRPILSDNCFKCHGPDTNKRKANLRLDMESGALADLGDGRFPIVPGKPEKSEVITRISEAGDQERKPPVDSGFSLTASQKALIRRWIDEGANWEKHWSFEPGARPKPPSVSAASWCRNEIDRFVLARLDEEGLKPSREADPTTLIRRVSLDLTGLPPTPAEVDTFLEDTSPEAYDQLVDRLLDSPRYGETMALQWLDAARYADTDGYQNDGPRSMWRWRDWVIQAYNRNMPFDQFTIEQLAGDLLPNPSLDQLIATGFNRNHRYNSESGLVLEEFLLENAVDRVDTTSTVWMGLTMGCARCHDHKFDPFSTKEYYQLISLFDNVPESGRAVKFGNSEPWVTAPTPEQASRLVNYDSRIDAAELDLNGSEDAIAHAQASWEESSARDADEGKFVMCGLTDFFSFNGTEGRVMTEKGSPTFTSGLIGEAVAFDGTGKLKLESEGQFLDQERFSVAFWLRPEDVSRGVILSKQANNTTRPGLAVELRGGRLQFYLITRWIAGVGAIETVEHLVPGTWRHVTLTNDGSQSATGMRIFLNGHAMETRILHNTNSNTGGSPKGAILRAGAGVYGDFFKGQVDELRIYSRTLWREEVAWLAEPLTVAAISRLEPAQRRASARAKIRAYFLEHDAPKRLRQQASNLFDARLQRQEFHDSLPTTMVMGEMDPPRPTHIRLRGVYHQHGELVQPALPEVFPSFDSRLPRNRLGLAKWLVSGAHPLTARVAVNRYWLRLFGRGLVKTAGDFGLQGDRPSHLDLLDWLADEFVRLDWDIKAMQKLIVSSATYRQDSRVTSALLEQDPENVLLARGPRQRLSAHAVRDQALAAGGLLVERIGGPSVSPYQPPKFWETLSNMTYKQSKGEDLYRRSLYTIWKRTIPPPNMSILDAADRESCTVNPKRTNTPLQALTLLNETTFVEAARNLGQRILTEGGTTLSEQVEFAFRIATARRPKAGERVFLETAYQEYRNAFRSDPAAAARLIAVGESKMIEVLDPIELAAAATLANVLLNLDEFITKE